MAPITSTISGSGGTSTRENAPQLPFLPPAPAATSAATSRTGTAATSTTNLETPRSAAGEQSAATDTRRKRRRVNKENESRPGGAILPGVGPPTALAQNAPGIAVHPAFALPPVPTSTLPSASAPPKVFGSLVRRAMNDRNLSRAVSTDIWASTFPVPARDKPEVIELYPSDGKMWLRQPKAEEGAFLACKFCTRMRCRGFLLALF